MENKTLEELLTDAQTEMVLLHSRMCDMQNNLDKLERVIARIEDVVRKRDEVA